MAKPEWVTKIQEQQRATGRPKKAENKITIPYNLKLREYQKPFWRAIQDDPVRRAVVVWHRRAGKDKVFINALCLQAIKRVAVYYYVFPEFNQGRKALWDNVDKDGFKTLDHIPQEIRTRTDKQQMLVELYNGSIIQIIGASDIDRIVGTNPAGIVFSEYSLMNPAVVGFLLPIVSENNGFMWFNFTPRGDNHAKVLAQQAQDNKDWFFQVVTVKDSKAIKDEELEKVKLEYYTLYKNYDLYEQEFMCSFNSAVVGSYYGEHLLEAENQNRIGKFPYLTNEPVHTFWDIGVRDTTAIWFAQFVGDKIYLIDYLEQNGKGMDYFIKEIKNKPYIYGDHFAPHDIKVREFGTGISRLETAKKFGINLKISPKLNVADGINAVRMILSRCYFNVDNDVVQDGVSALKNYHKEFDEVKKTYRDKPLHDWSSNSADAFRYLAVNYNKLNNISSIADTMSNDIPDYAKTGNSGMYSQRRNPFSNREEIDMDLTTDAFNKDGWVR